MSYRYEERLCRLCDGYDRTYSTEHGGYHIMFQTGIRSYAHARCLVEKYGLKEAKTKLQYQNDWHYDALKKSAKYPIKKSGDHPLISEIERMKVKE